RLNGEIKVTVIATGFVSGSDDVLGRAYFEAAPRPAAVPAPAPAPAPATSSPFPGYATYNPDDLDIPAFLRDRRYPRGPDGQAPHGGREGPRAVRCPYCQHGDSKVVDSRDSETGEAIRRRRECLHCGKRFTTYERVEAVPIYVVKKDGRREEFDRAKLLG